MRGSADYLACKGIVLLVLALHARFKPHMELAQSYQFSCESPSNKTAKYEVARTCLVLHQLDMVSVKFLLSQTEKKMGQVQRFFIKSGFQDQMFIVKI